MRLALAGRGVEVRREAARRRAADQQPAVLGAGDGDRAAGEVGQHRRAGQRGLGARRDRHPHVLADLDVQHEAGHVGGPEEQVGAERHVGRRRRRWSAPRWSSPGREVPPLVELAVGRQVGLRRDAEDRAAVDDDARSCRPGCRARSGAPTTSTGRRSAVASTIAGDRLVDGVEQRVLQEQVVDGVAAQAQLGEDRDARRRRRGRSRACASTASALRSGSTATIGSVHAATRAKPWAYEL